MMHRRDTWPTFSENDSKCEDKAVESIHSNDKVESEDNDVDSLRYETSQSERANIGTPIISKCFIETINAKQPPNTPTRDELDSNNAKIDSIFAQIEEFMTDISSKIKNLNLQIETLEKASESNNKAIIKEFANLNEKLENKQIKMQTAFDGLRAELSFGRNNEANVKSRVKVMNRGNQERIHNRFYGNCGCNALSNFYRCICRGLNECNYKKYSATKVSPVCFCCCSFIKGSNENSNRINCNCCQSLTNEKSE